MPDPAAGLAARAARASGWHRPPRAWVTAAFVAANLAVYLAMVARGVPARSPTSAELVGWGANYGPLVYAGEWWRLPAAGFLHVGILHLGLNLFSLLAVGPPAERLVGPLRYAVAYLFAVLASSLVSVWFQPGTVSAGASGAVFGVCGLLLALSVRDWGPRGDRGRRALRRMVGPLVAVNLAGGFFLVPNVDNAGHLGGLAAGLIAGLVLGRFRQPVADRRGALRLLLVGGLVVGGLFAATRHRLDRAFGWPPKLVAVWQEVDEALRTAEAERPSGDDRTASAVYADTLDGRVVPALRTALGRLDSLPPEADASVTPLRGYLAAVAEAYELTARAVRQDDDRLMVEANRRLAAAAEQLVHRP